MTLRGFGAAAEDVLDGQFFISFFICPPECGGEPSLPPSFTYTVSAFEVRLTGAEPIQPVPLLPSLISQLTGLAFLGMIAFWRKRPALFKRATT
jgi:hypothetical protein